MKKLTERDRERLLVYVGAEPEVNLFFIGDVENFGVESDEVGVWAEEHGGDWDSVVLRYMGDYVVYSRRANYDAEAVGTFLKTQNAGMISGKLGIVRYLSGFFPERSLRPMILTRCDAVKADFATPPGADVRMLTAGDAEALAGLLMRIDEFKKSYPDRESTIRKLRTSLSCGGTGCGGFVDGRLVSCAQTGAGNSMSAMVLAVATDPELRGGGLASAVVSRLCTDAFHTGKQFLCLFYDNPQAGRIYNRIGFNPIDDYALFR